MVASGPRGMVGPHHLIVKKYIDELYLEVSNEQIERVILMGPNHFNYGMHNIQSTDAWENLDLEMIEVLAQTTPLAVEPLYFDKEHAIHVHLDYIDEFFPNAELVPIIFKRAVF